MKGAKWVAVLVLCALAGHAVAVDLGHFIRKDKFTDIKLSPTGEYYAATVPMEDKTALAVFRRKDNVLTGTFVPARNGHVGGFDWVNDERVLISLAEKFGVRDQPQATGEIYAINADGGQADLLVGYRVQDNGPGTRIQPKKVEMVVAFLTDPLPNDDRHAVISVWPMTGTEPFTRAEKLDVRNGRRVPIARAPVRRASFTTDNTGEVRLTHGAGVDNVNKLYYREGAGSEWRLINDEDVSGRIETPLGFSEDNRLVYLQIQAGQGTDTIVAWDPASGERKQVLHDKGADPLSIIYRNGTSMPVGAQVMDGRHKTLFFDETSPEARMYRSLEAAFGGDPLFVTSSTKDGRLMLVRTWSGNNPGDFFLYDTVARKASHLISRSDWVDPNMMATVELFTFNARDLLPIHGYMTVPRGVSGARPMVVMPHGGPFGIFDTWEYDRDAQMLAAAGYTVLQVNYRGSGNYGRAFQHAGARQWGGTMQDDVTDATRWAIAQGHADPRRICIYGASYGAYAALMGVAKEPGLYQCAAGYVGVYDLPLMHSTGDIQGRRSGETYLREWLGERSQLAAVSPVNLADRIKVPVFLAAGGKDERAPIQHSKRMAAALEKAGVPVETLYYDTEGHGFYTEPHQREYYTKLLGFLSRHLGGRPAQGAAQP
ncbi:S9 family peptidase [Stenotrophomonas sp. YIM B06876]|uniref:alpha/beta hydrolase family protein n=1 Tax=Stenotrophomonas sp. YIM B06876 TaxID=3060211 RepID=UPI0027383B0C|nr:S9 family peptidase [Stenotrophomonas sp. YIM B06876]